MTFWRFAGDAPWWVFFTGGFSVLFYLHLDCIDGKQARRTKSSSPLGQLFDHGEDPVLSALIVRSSLNGEGRGKWEGCFAQGQHSMF